jgi:hypothetical protein
MNVESSTDAAEHNGLLGSAHFSEGPSNTIRMQFLTWENVAGLVIEIPCACAFKIIALFVELVIPSRQPWEQPST